MRLLLKRLNNPLYLSWLLVVISLSLILRSGLYSDDMVNLQIRASDNDFTLIHLMRFLIPDMHEGINCGRFTPFVYAFMEFFYWVSASVLIFKLIVFSMNLLAVFTFTRFLRALGLDSWVPVALLTYCSVVQFYISYHDPFTSLHAMYPTMAVFIFGTLILFISFLKRGKIILLVCTVLASFLLVFYSETGLIIFPLLLVLLIGDSRGIRQKVAIFSPLLGVLVLYAIIIVSIRSHTTVFYEGVDMTWYFPAVSSTFLIQVVSSVPLISLVETYPYFRFPTEHMGFFIGLAVLSVIILTLFIRQIVRSPLPMIGGRWTVALSGLTLLLVPPVMIMLTKKYQRELHLGIGYLPVYIQDFGLVLLALLLFDYFFRRFAVRSKVIYSVVFVFIFLLSSISFVNNNSLICKMNKGRFIPGMFYYQSLKHGILSDCPPGSVIAMRSDYFFHGIHDYQKIINTFYPKGFKVFSAEDFYQGKATGGKNMYMLEYRRKDEAAVLYRLEPGMPEKEVKRINYPKGKDFSFFELISAPL